MTTVIKNDGASGESSGLGMVLGIILAIVLIVLFFVYALPALRGSGTPDTLDVNVDLPSPSAPDLNPAQ
jgi:hypothetical protein